MLRLDDAVSIHAPREGCDCDYQLHSQRYRKFQFTHPGRGATLIIREVHQVAIVSIHAPREGCDLIMVLTFPVAVEFQFTHPGRGATLYLAQ